MSGHTARAFYIGYPDEQRKPTRGLVSSISENPPVLNWIYVDKDTLELKFGNRTQSREHIVGPWDWTKDKAGITIEGAERFAAVKEGNCLWAMYYDRDGDSLRGILNDDRTRVEVNLMRTLLSDEENL